MGRRCRALLRPRARQLALVGAAGLAALCALPGAPRAAVPAQPSVDGGEEPAMGFAAALQYTQSAILPLRKEVDAGNIVAQFGAKANGVLLDVARRAPEAERAAEGMLHSLFLRQLATLRRRLAAAPDRGARTLDAVAEADRAFVAQAKELKRPGSDWSYDSERYALRAELEGHIRRASELSDQRVLAAQSQQSTGDIIGKLQSQMENLQQKVQAMRAGAPWFLSSSYRIPGTPFQIIGRYQQGRANFELGLHPDKDPANSEAGFVSGITPANIGIRANLGL